MAGFRSAITDKMKLHCGNCRSAVDLTEVNQEIFEAIIQLIREGKPVRIQGFGVFTARMVASARRRLLSGEYVILPARRVVRFTPAERVKKLVNTAISNEEDTNGNEEQDQTGSTIRAPKLRARRKVRASKRS